MKQKRTYRLCALLLCGALLTPALAAEPPGPEEEAGNILTWDALDERILEGSLNIQVLDENIGSIESIDYDMMEDQLRKQLNQLADAQWAMLQLGNDVTANTLQQSYTALRDTFDAIRDGASRRTTPTPSGRPRTASTRSCEPARTSTSA